MKRLILSLGVSTFVFCLLILFTAGAGGNFSGIDFNDPILKFVIGASLASGFLAFIKGPSWVSEGIQQGLKHPECEVCGNELKHGNFSLPAGLWAVIMKQVVCNKCGTQVFLTTGKKI